MSNDRLTPKYAAVLLVDHQRTAIVRVVQASYNNVAGSLLAAKTKNQEILMPRTGLGALRTQDSILVHQSLCFGEQN
jgi:hypothetical protein